MRPTLDAAVALATARLEEDGLRPVVAAHDIWLAAGLQRALPGTALACISSSDAVDVLRGRGTEVFCLSEHSGPEATAGMSSLDLLRHPATGEFFRSLGPTAVLSFKPSERIAEAVTALGGRLLAAPSSAARAYENKLAFVAAAERAGVPRPRWDARRLPLVYADLVEDFGAPVVVQGPRGNAGQRTWLVDNQAQLDVVNARERSGSMRVAEWIDGLPFTASGVAFRGDGAGIEGGHPPAVNEPCRQVTGVDWLTPEQLGSCGNAWGEGRLVAHRAEIERCVRALGADLAANNYRGLFGVDFVLAADGPLVIEVNPRMVASLPEATELDVEAGRAPLVLLHLLEMLDADLGALSAEDATAPVGVASQVIVHQFPHDPPRRPRGGVYSVSDDGPPAYLRPGAGLEDVRDGNELLLLVRRTAEPVTPGKECARIYARSDQGENTTGVRQLVHALRTGGL